MGQVDRQRRHDERWQHEVLDALARMLDVLHDISDGVRALAESTARQTPAVQSEAPGAGLPQLLSVKGLADLLGVSTSAVYSLRATGNAPPVTRLGARLYFNREDVTAWLREQRQDPESGTRLWREAYIPGRVGSRLPRSSERKPRSYCAGSNTEPMAASRWSGRAVCQVCRDDVLVNRDGRLRKHYPRSW
jgi:predicted DNA-binding transcriptional regulator AlpA